jgi:hypothetical protein
MTATARSLGPRVKPEGDERWGMLNWLTVFREIAFDKKRVK